MPVPVVRGRAATTITATTAAAIPTHPAGSIDSNHSGGGLHRHALPHRPGLDDIEGAGGGRAGGYLGPDLRTIFEPKAAGDNSIFRRCDPEFSRKSRLPPDGGGHRGGSRRSDHHA